jgi:hypothetical protein
MVDPRENGGTEDFNNVLPLCRQPLLQHPLEGSKLPQRVRLPKSNL